MKITNGNGKGMVIKLG